MINISLTETASQFINNTFVDIYRAKNNMENTKEHWEKVFDTKTETEVSWFQPYPKTSVEFINLFDLGKDKNIIDVGGGDSHFIDALIDMGYQNIYLLDISAKAIERVKQRLGAKADRVNYIVSDILDFKSSIHFDFWHDRAAFHFLTTEEQVDKYVTIAENAISKDGYLVLGTFSESGPTKCSGLEIQQYNEISMRKRFEKYFERIKCIEDIHTTPFNTTQNFLFCSFKKFT